jgi:putative restriction endonuclease
MTPFIALTDKSWFDFLSSRTSSGVLDEVNFWSPRAKRPMKTMTPGDPIFFRLKAPHNAIAGYGFFALFRVLDLDLAWDMFGERNGDPDRLHFFDRIGKYRGVDLFDARSNREPLGCTVLRTSVFWPKERWIPWGAEQGWASNIVQGKTETDSGRVELLVSAMADDAPQELSSDPFVVVDVDERKIELARHAVREGQGTFRARLLDAYGGRCAITGEHTEPVLDAAHIQPYLGPRSNHLQNGLLLTKEFHVLFDQGYVTVTPDYVIRVSERLRSAWANGKRYYPYDGQSLMQLPRDPGVRPSRDALAWHGDRVFRHVA